MMKKTGPIFVFAALALAGCGGRVPLTPVQGASLPPKPETAAAVPTPEQLLVPGVQTRPLRSDELLKRSEERRDDKFDLPPS